MNNNENQNQPQNPAQNNNNVRRFDNPFNLDPSKEDIQIEMKLDRDFFCPLMSMTPEFGIGNNYYSILHAKPLEESFFHLIEALLFPNATFLQISSILCYIAIFLFIILLCFGIDETNLKSLLPIKLSTVDKFATFYPKKIKDNPFQLYRLFTFHFFHFNSLQLFYSLFGLVSFCSTFEMLVKKRVFLCVFFLTGIFTNLSMISLFNDDERYCGLNSDINGIFGAFIMFFIMNWKESLKMFDMLGRILTLYILTIFAVFYCVKLEPETYGASFLQILSLVYGGLIYAVIAKPIQIERWKTIVRIFSGVTVLSGSLISLIRFYLI